MATIRGKAIDEVTNLLENIDGTEKIPVSSGESEPQVVLTGELKDYIQEGMQDELTFDQAPTSGSSNPVTSGGVYANTISDITQDDDELVITKNGQTSDMTINYAERANRDSNNNVIKDYYAPIDSPSFGGTPRALTPPSSSNDTRLATTAFVNSNTVSNVEIDNTQLLVTKGGTTTSQNINAVTARQATNDIYGRSFVTYYAPKDSPTLTGTPTAPTASSGDDSTQIATTAFVQNALDTIEAVIPSAASSSNQLADKAFVNSSISTNTATFRGTYNSLAELQEQTADNNDYGFVVDTDAQGNRYYNRYKYNGTSWEFEYSIESTPFTDEQWDAIQSGIDSALVTKLSALPTATELSTQLSGKQDTLVSGTNIKTINNQSLLGSGNITIEAGTQITVDDALSSSSENPVQNKVINTALGTKANSADLATVATSGDYDDLSNKPTIPTVNNATLTIQKEGTSVGTFTANASSNSTINIVETDPVFVASAAHGITSSDITNWNNSPVLGDDDGQASDPDFDAYTDTVWHTEQTLSSAQKLQARTNIGAADASAVVTSFNGSTGAVTYSAPVTSVNGSTGAVTVSVPTKTSDLQNDSGYITSAPVSSVNGQTGAVTVQETLVSGTNIKTINNTSLLGSGNITIEGGGSSVQSDWDETDTTSAAYILNKPNIPSVVSAEFSYYSTDEELIISPANATEYDSTTEKLTIL